MNYDMQNVDDEMVESPNRDEKDLGVNLEAIYDFPLDENDSGCNDDGPSIARYVDGTGLLASKNILADREDTHVQIAERKGVAFVNDGTPQTNEVIPIRKFPFTAVAEAEENDGDNEKGGCEVKVQMNVSNTSVELEEIFTSKNSGEPSIENDKLQEVEKHGGLHSMKSESLTLTRDDKGKKQVIQDPKLPPRSGSAPAPRALFTTASTTLNGAGSSQHGKQHCSISKEEHRVFNPSVAVSARGDDDEEETLASIFARCSSHPLRCSLKSSDPIPLSSNATKLIIHGGTKGGQPLLKESKKAKPKRVMEPFAISPSKRQNVARTPIDVCQPISQMKMKPVDGFREGIGKSILRAKREQKKGRTTRSLACKAVQEGGRTIVQSSSDDMEDTCNDEDAGWETKGDSSGAEVKGDSDYKP